jgi:hypothetical protein
MTSPQPLTVTEVLALADEQRWNDLLIRLAENIAADPGVVKQLEPDEVVKLTHLLLLLTANDVIH